jgi:P-type Mg2+ transporter
MGKREISLERFWDRPLPDLLHLLQTTPAGLSSAEATQRLRLYGANSFLQEARFTTLVSFLRLVTNPLVIILLVASGISLVLGDPVGGLIIICIVLLSVAELLHGTSSTTCNGGNSKAGCHNCHRYS